MPMLTVTNDTPVPSVTIARPSAETGPVKDNAFEVEITFSEEMAGFELTDIAVQNGTATNLSSGQQMPDDTERYTVDITATRQGHGHHRHWRGCCGPVSVRGPRIPPRPVSASLPTRRHRRCLFPVLAAPSGGRFTVSVNFSEDVTGADGTDLAVPNGTASDWEAVGSSKRNYRATITPRSGPTEITVEFQADRAMDLAGNPNTKSNAFTRDRGFRRANRHYDRTLDFQKTVRGEAGILTSILRFSSTVQNFIESDITVTGSGRVQSGSLSGSGRNWTATIEPTGSFNATPIELTVERAWK